VAELAPNAVAVACSECWDAELGGRGYMPALLGLEAPAVVALSMEKRVGAARAVFVVAAVGTVAMSWIVDLRVTDHQKVNNWIALAGHPAERDYSSRQTCLGCRVEGGQRRATACDFTARARPRSVLHAFPQNLAGLRSANLIYHRAYITYVNIPMVQPHGLPGEDNTCRCSCYSARKAY
jgi:hypothetical protein